MTPTSPVAVGTDEVTCPAIVMDRLTAPLVRSAVLKTVDAWSVPSMVVTTALSAVPHPGE